MVERFLNSLLARLRFAVSNLPLLPLAAFGLVVIAALIQFMLLPSREAAIEAAEHKLARLERSTRRAQMERQVEHASPEETRQQLLERFPSESELNAELGRLLEMAKAQGLQVSNGDYRLLPGKDGLFDRYVLNLPVKGSYQAIRHFVSAARSALPALAVEDFTLRRESLATPEVEVQLRFVLFGRRAVS